MPLTENDIDGRTLDLLGRAQNVGPLSASTLGTVFPIFTTNNKQWPAGSGKTFVAYLVFSLPNGATFASSCSFDIGVNGGADWATSGVALPIPLGNPPWTLYAGTSLNAQNLPGNYANGLIFGLKHVGISGSFSAPLTVSAYGWCC